MRIEDIDEKSLPFYTIEVQDGTGNWNLFTELPFETEKEAEEHVAKMLMEYSFIARNRVKIRHYTADDWRKDMIELIVKDPDTIRRALSVFRDGFLADLLK